jgi:hypothetical protein
MAALVWLAIPLVVLAIAILWVIWASRPKPRADTHETLEERERFKAVFDPHRREVPRRKRR